MQRGRPRKLGKQGTQKAIAAREKARQQAGKGTGNTATTGSTTGSDPPSYKPRGKPRGAGGGWAYTGKRKTTTLEKEVSLSVEEARLRLVVTKTNTHVCHDLLGEWQVVASK